MRHCGCGRLWLVPGGGGENLKFSGFCTLPSRGIPAECSTLMTSHVSLRMLMGFRFRRNLRRNLLPSQPQLPMGALYNFLPPAPGTQPLDSRTDRLSSRRSCPWEECSSFSIVSDSCVLLVRRRDVYLRHEHDHPDGRISQCQ